MGTSQSTTLTQDELSKQLPAETMSKEERKALKFKRLLEEEMMESIYPLPDAHVIKTACRKPARSVHQKAQRVIMHAIPMGGKERMVNLIDMRKQIHATNKWPYSVHGVVLCKSEDGKKQAWGTGTLIGPNVVLTAGHNLYWKETKTESRAENVQFFPGMNGDVPPFGVIGVEQVFVSPYYLKDGEKDYAILILKKPIGEATGYFGFSCLEPEEIKKKTINVTGYPGDKVASKSGIYEMWGMEGRVCSVDEDQGILHHKIDTFNGQSGSGIYYQEGEDYYVCGVHSDGGDPLEFWALFDQRYISKDLSISAESK